MLRKGNAERIKENQKNQKKLEWAKVPLSRGVEIETLLPREKLPNLREIFRIPINFIQPAFKTPYSVFYTYSIEEDLPKCQIFRIQKELLLARKYWSDRKKARFSISSPLPNGKEFSIDFVVYLKKNLSTSTRQKLTEKLTNCFVEMIKNNGENIFELFLENQLRAYFPQIKKIVHNKMFVFEKFSVK